MERVKSGIPGLDELTGGGLPRNHLILVTGTSGTGKTVFGTQFVYTGVKRFRENSVYLSFEEPAETIAENAKGFGWDFKELERQGKFTFIKYDPYHIEDVFDILESEIRNIKATRVVVDSISALGLHVRDDAELRRMIFNLSLALRKLSCTSIIISEIVPGTRGLSRYGVEEFVADGVIVLYYERIETSFARTLHVWKMRGSKHSEKLHPYKIDTSGITVYPEEEAFMKER
ncbi:MAG: AAA family ATPase [Candidatus Aenigmarchaeota archaeon]|nr:AAA family ATPase [Candidatus Aenigmarchaeota archaeon]